MPSVHWNTVGLMQTEAQKYRSCEQTHSVVCDNVHKVFTIVECCMDEQSCWIMTWKKILSRSRRFASALLRKLSRSMERNANFSSRKICFSKQPKRNTLSVQVSFCVLWNLFGGASLNVQEIVRLEG